MVTNLRKKNSRHRGSWTNSHGEKKKHRGAGSRGGRGHAGSGKRGDAKKPSYWKIKNFSGKHGFTKHNQTACIAATISQLNINLKYLVEKEMVVKEGNKYVIDLNALGIDKLIATGTPKFAFDLKVDKATLSAIDKINAAGGNITLKKEESAPKKE